MRADRRPPGAARRALAWLIALSIAGPALLGAPGGPTLALAATPAPTGLVATMPVIAGEPVLAWDRLVGADVYRVQIATTPTFDPVSYDATTVQRSATPELALTPGTHHWRVAARVAGTWGPWSTSTFVRSVTSLATPTLLGPANDAVIERLNDAAVMSWSAVPGAAKYELQWSRSAAMTDPFVGFVRSTHHIPHFLNPGDTFHWRVRAVARDDTTTSGWSATRSMSMHLSTGVGGLAPADGSQARDTVMTWSAVPGAARYRVQVSPADVIDWSHPDVDEYLLASTVLELEDVHRDGAATYRWRVRAEDTEGYGGPWSAPRTIVRTVSDPPTLIAPSDGAASGSVTTLRWTPVQRAVVYRVEVASDASFGDPITHFTTETEFDLTTREDTEPFVLTRGQLYHWRVMGLDAYHGEWMTERPAGPWSAARTFTYLPTVSQLLGPADGAAVSVPTLSWAPADARYHRVTIEAADGTIVDRTVTWASTYTPRVALDPSDGPFTWYLERVAAPGGPGSTVAWRTAERTFTLTQLSGGATVDLLVSADLHTYDNPRIRWTPVEGAAYYHIVVPPIPPATVEFKYTEDAPIIYPDFTFTDSGQEPERRTYQVWAYAAGGAVLAKSVTAQWTIDRLPAPTGLWPDCGGVGCPVYAEPPRLSWSAVPGATVYGVSDHGGRTWDWTPVTSATNVALGQDTPPSSAIGGIRWYVRACVAGRCSDDAFGTYRKGGAAPAAVSPPDGADLTGPQVTLDWKDLIESPVGAGEIGTSQSEPAMYRIIMWPRDPGDPLAGASGTDRVEGTRSTYLVSPGTWRWSVVGETVGFFSETSTERTFTVTWPGPQAASPPSGAVSSTMPAFRWSATSFTDRYEIQVHRGTSPSGEPAVSATSDYPAYTHPDELGAGTYTWRVRSAGAAGWSSWSAPRTFSVTAGSAPSLTAPAQASTVAAGLTTFDWSDVPGAVTYRMETSRTSTFSVIETSVVTGQSTWAPRERLAGTLYWRVHALGPSESIIATSLIRSVTGLADTTSPVATAPTHAFLTGSTIQGGRISMRLRWSGSDADSGIARYEVQQQVDGGTWTVVATSIATPSTDRHVSSTDEVRFRVRAVDRAGNVSPWATGRTVAVARFSEINRRVRYSGTWRLASGRAFWGGAAKRSSSAGSRTSITFTGRSIAWVARMGPDRGKAAVYVNARRVATVDLYAPTYRNQRVAWSRSWSTTASRKVTIVVLGTPGRPRVDLDAFVTAD